MRLLVGVAIGRYILRKLLESRRRIWIASPYVSPELVNELPIVEDGRILVSSDGLDSRLLSVAREAKYVVKILRGLHAKIYVADSIAAIGSLNFTLWGVHTNYEVAIVSYEGEELFLEIARAYEVLWDLADLATST